MSDINEYRAQIDAIDDKILKLLEKRASIVGQVGELKSKSKGRSSIIRPGREAEMIRRILADARGDKDIILKKATAQIWRTIIASAINMEEDARVSALALPGNRESYWLAREYFGSFTPTEQRPTHVEVMQDVLKGESTVGVLQIVGENVPQPWWSRLIEAEDAPKIFARLPFVVSFEINKPPLVALGYVEPEDTGDDDSIWVIKTPETVGFAAIELLFEQSKLDMKLLEECRILGNPNTHQALVRISGFVSDKTRQMKNFLKMANELSERRTVPIEGVWLGSYARQIFFNSEEKQKEGVIERNEA